MLTRIRNLEENVLHNVAAVWALELELVTLEEVVVETPARSVQDSRDTALALENLQDKVDGALARITGSPRLPRHGVGRVTVCAQALAVDPGLGDGIGSLLLGQAQQLRGNSSSGDLDKHDVVQADLVERVFQSQNALDLVGLDHGLENITDLQDLALADVSTSTVGAGDPVCHRQNTTQVVRGVAPFGRKPAVVVVKPPDNGTNVESAVHGVQLVRGTWDLGAVGDNSALDDRAEQLCALFESESLQPTAEGVEENKTSSVELTRD